jgi:hypothetical protein
MISVNGTFDALDSEGGGGILRHGRQAAGVTGMPAFLLLLIAVLVAVAFYLDNEPVEPEHESDHKSPGKHTLHHRY